SGDPCGTECGGHPGGGDRQDRARYRLAAGRSPDDGPRQRRGPPVRSGDHQSDCTSALSRMGAAMAAGRIVDCHAHIIDPARFPFPEGPGYRPRSDEAGPCEAYLKVLDRHEVGHALLVQPSGYAYDNAAMLDALAHAHGRFKAIV